MGHVDLNAAVVLVRVVQACSFRGGARALGMPKTTVSRKVAELEEQLGAQLLQRTTRKLALTDAGAAFVEQAEEALAHLEAAEQAVTELQREPRGRVRVTATTAMGQTLLTPLLAEFLAAHPAVDVVLQLTDRHVDLVAERIDVALRAGPLPDSSLVAHRVGTSVMQLVASPRYLKDNGTPMVPADLAGHQCVLFAKTGAAARATWPLGRGKRVREVPVTGRFVADDMQVLRAAAERGVGIARLPAVLVRDAVRRRRLVPLLEEFSTQEVPLHLVHLGGRHVPARTRALINFLRVKIAAELTG